MKQTAAHYVYKIICRINVENIGLLFYDTRVLWMELFMILIKGTEKSISPTNSF